MKKLLLGLFVVLTSHAAHVNAQYVDRTKVTEVVATTATLQSAATANGDGTTLDISGYSSVSFMITGTFSATVNFEATGDDANWVSLETVQIGPSTISTTSISAGIFSAAVGSLKSVRARVSGYASGSITVIARASLAKGPNPQTVTGNLGITDASGNAITSTSNALDVNIKSGNPTTITATQGTGTNLHTVVDSGAVNTTLQSGSALVGKVGIDQTTPGTTNKVTVGSDVVHAIVDSGAVTATVSDGAGALNVIVDSGTTGVTGNVTVVQPTGTNLHAVLDANSGVDIGKLTANQSVNVAQINGVTTTTGNGASGTGVQRVTIANDSTGQLALAAGSNTIGALTANQSVNVSQINGVTVLMGNGTTGTGSQRVTLASDNTANSNPWLAQPVPGTANGASTCVVQSAASTNATNCKNGAGLIYGIEVINTTSTLYYLRLYNLSASPTCSSATGFVRTVPIPHGSGAGAGIANFYTVGETYGTGIGFCLTGGGSSTDNSNAATGIYISLHYK